MYKFAAAFLLLTLIGVCLNAHFVRLDGGVVFLAKDSMSFRDTYVDVREWGIADYFSHSERIREYLLFERKYQQLVQLVEETQQTINAKLDTLTEGAKRRLAPIELTLHEWLAERLESEGENR